VEIYRTRWLIEEFFKALKTGCGMEQRELESLHTLTNALALCIPIAYQLLALRHLARSKPTAPAHLVLSPTQLAILQAKARLVLEPNAQQALEAVAYLGSHFVPFSRKQPGWRVLARGMEKLLALKEGWLAARAAEMRSNVSRARARARARPFHRISAHIATGPRAFDPT
jgi:hypothetical protein